MPKFRGALVADGDGTELVREIGGVAIGGIIGIDYSSKISYCS